MAAVTVSTLGVLGVVNPAFASHDGTGSILSSSNGAVSIEFTDIPALSVVTNVSDASWSPDGSRAVFVDGEGAILTVRHNNGQDLVNAASSQGAQRSHPTWSSDGRLITWAEKASSNEPWRLQTTTTTGAEIPSLTSPDDDFHYTHPDYGPAGLLVFQRQADNAGAPTGTPEVWLQRPEAEDPVVVITDAGNPALSPNGTRIAFVRGGQIYTSDLTGTNLIQVTSNATAKDNPVWSHDGSTIAFNTGTAGAVATAPANGSGAASPTVVTGLAGQPAYQTRIPNEIVRLAGSTRFTTPVAVSNQVWATAGATSDTRKSARSVVLSRSDSFADALGGASLAAAKQGPLLLTPPDSLNADTRAEITRVLGGDTSATVYLLGGTGAISQVVQNAVAAMGYRVVRLAGDTRYDTSIAIANAIDPTPDMVFAATGTDFPDALPSAAAAGSFNVPGTGSSAVVILTNGSVLPVEIGTYLNRVTANGETPVVAVGGPASTATSTYHPVSLVGATRYHTAYLVGRMFFDGEAYAGVATGVDWPDALAGGALMATLNGPLLLTPATSTLDPNTALLLDLESPAIHTGIVFGATGVVNAAIDGQIGTQISGPAGFTASAGTLLDSDAAGTTGPRTPSPASTEHRSVEDLKAAAKKILSEQNTR